MTSCSYVARQVSGSATIKDDKDISQGIFDQVFSSVPYYLIQLLLPLAVVMFWIATPVVDVS